MVVSFKTLVSMRFYNNSNRYEIERFNGLNRYNVLICEHVATWIGRFYKIRRSGVRFLKVVMCRSVKQTSLSILPLLTQQ